MPALPLRTVGLLAMALAGQAQTRPTPEQLEFFETRIRPVLAKNCYSCHGANSKSAAGGLFLTTRAALLQGGQSGPAVVPGKPDESLLIKAVRYEGRRMPPAGKLPDAVIADLEKWVAMGAADPRESGTEWKESSIDVDKGRQAWAYQTPKLPAAPAVKNGKWSKERIDRLLLAKLEAKRLTPAPDADKATLLRRVSFDLTGLPPSPEELQSFLTDKRPDAYARVVDRLLASERFGERWGRHWLDVARYAESVGRGRNYAMPVAWRYRDWVIDAFNQDKPYNEFVMEQIAGDLLPAASDQQRDRQLIATAFLSLGSHDLIEQNPQMFRMDVIDEQIHATSKAFLGLTVGCARCHDHKFDPIPTADYYAMAGIFQSTEMLSGLQRRPRDNVSYFNIDLLARLKSVPAEDQPAWMRDPTKVEEFNKLLAQINDARNGRFLAMVPVKQRKQMRDATPQQRQQKIRQTVTQLLVQLDRYELPHDLAMAVKEGRIEDCRIHIKGDPKQLGPSVPRGFVQVASAPGATRFEIGPNESGRLQLARWLARDDHPLTARVMVNRIWHHLFGRGIVATVDNFGKMGEAPTHPELLDYLAVRFVQQGWSTKKMVREIVLSRAYRMSTAHQERNHAVDPDNKLFWRQNRRRLEVEALRDALLQIAGKLDLSRPQGSPVFGFRRGFDIGRGAGAQVMDYAVAMNTRSVYVPVVRNFLPAMYEVFDFPEPSEVKGRREVTTVPTQALFLVNSPFALEQSKRAAGQLLAGSASGRERVQRAYREVLAREARAEEVEKALRFLDAIRSEAGAAPDEKTAWARFYQALFASAEFRYRS